MSIVDERVQIIEGLKQKVQTHCMCLEFEDDGSYYRVFYPEGYYPNGIQQQYKFEGKAKALKLILHKIEQHWLESFQGALNSRESYEGTEGMKLDDFDELWKKLSEDGVCDSLGGMEYQRVRAEWFNFDCEMFIKWRANISPHDTINFNIKEITE